MTTAMKSIDATAPLNNGAQMPYLGLGVFKAEKGEQCHQAVQWALEAGYRHIDTAAVYGNEESVGRAVADSDVPREDVFVTTKVWNSDQGYDSTKQALAESLERMGMEYVDLYLIHWPARQRHETWDAMVELMQAGRARAIGVSNFTTRHLDELKQHSDVIPAVNQVEFHPWLYQKDLLEYCQRQNIQLEAYSPLIRGQKLDDATLNEIAARYHKTPAQILIRWNLEHGVVAIPKSVHKDRIEENADVFDFKISDGDMATLDGLNENLRTTPPSWDPENWE